MLKDEPDDLTHLAPTAGDTCISLEESTPFFTDMFDDLMLPENYCTLLQDDINSLDSQSSKTNSTDPFINYRDESSDTGGTPNMLSPGLSKVNKIYFYTCHFFFVRDKYQNRSDRNDIFQFQLDRHYN